MFDSDYQKGKNSFVIGITGATCSGKSTLANKIRDNFSGSVVMCQDDYFLSLDDPRHVKIQELNHINWELITSMDMQKMHSDIVQILQSHKPDAADGTRTRILILDGFLLFKHKPITDLCDRKYFLTLTKEQCWERRKDRTYDPPDVPGYFDKVVWPEYVKYENEVTRDSELYKTVRFIDGSKNMEEIYEMITKEISQLLS
ncbi:nicotinamide riboside kinase 1 [Linepithema humile]|uniref:nicotinamide riboside kinase 1 n=1 Tax=Linepithema humile TaxID=83485 RepID=UPI0006234D96|nr:PREDICTED: nicotinamide riboside kinase 1 [Linepithema humile]